MKIAYPGDLNSIEAAVWAAEYVRVRADRTRGGFVYKDDVVTAIEEANRAIDDLRHAVEHS